MKRIILNEHGEKLLKQEILKESYSDKVELVKKFLDGNFMRGTFVTDAKDGTKKSIGIFIKLNNGMPTDSSCMYDDVFDMVQNKFVNIFGDKKERDGFLSQVIKDWYDKKISKYGSLSNYNW